MSTKNLLKFAVGATLLVYLIWFSYTNGNVLSNFSVRLCTINVIIFMHIILSNSLLLRWISHIFPIPLTLMEATIVTSVGAFANAAGGLPIGTMLVFGILVKKHQYDLRNLFIGKVIASFISIASLFLIFSLSFLVSHTYHIFAVTLLLWVLGMGALYIALDRPFRFALAQLQAKSLGHYLLEGCAYAFAGACLMVLAYFLLIQFYKPELPTAESIAMSSLSLIIGFSILANAIGGLQEVVVGLSAMAYSLDFSFGVEIGLFNRFCAILAAITVSIIALSIRRFRNSQAFNPQNKH